MISVTTLAIVSSYIMVLGNKKIAQPYSKVSYHPKSSLGSRFSFHSVSLQLSCSVVSDSATPWTAARQASLSITNSSSLLTHVHQVGDAIQPSDTLIFNFQPPELWKNAFLLF